MLLEIIGRFKLQLIWKNKEEVRLTFGLVYRHPLSSPLTPPMYWYNRPQNLNILNFFVYFSILIFLQSFFNYLIWYFTAPFSLFIFFVIVVNKWKYSGVFTQFIISASSVSYSSYSFPLPSTSVQADFWLQANFFFRERISCVLSTMLSLKQSPVLSE